MAAFDLSGRVALVTGAGVGIGRAIALALGGAGAAVGIHYHTSQRDAEMTLEMLQQRGGSGFLLPADLTKEDEAATVVDRLVAQTGRLDILVNNAGSPLRFTKIEDCPTDLWRQVFDVNVTSAFFVTRRAIPHLRGGHGSIINNLSLSVQTGGAGGGGPYAAAKGALQVLTRTLARELAPTSARQRHHARRGRDAPPRGVHHGPAHGGVPAANAVGTQWPGRRGRPGGTVLGRRRRQLRQRCAARHQRRPLLALVGPRHRRSFSVGHSAADGTHHSLLCFEWKSEPKAAGCCQSLTGETIRHIA